MRGILFRGKNLKTGKWTQGYLFRCWERAYIARGMVNDNADMIEVEPKTVCQYTGLTDKNGRKIFEGDIVDCHEKRGAAFWRCKVLWNEENSRFDVSTMDCGFPMCIDGYGSDIFIRGLDYKVIGNIFDNPELIGGKEE